MRKIVQKLGATVFSLMMYSVPIILTLSFVYDWGTFYQWMCCIAAIVQFTVLLAIVLYKVEEDEL